MAIDFSIPILSLEGVAIDDVLAMQTNGGVKKTLTLGAVVCHALNTSFQEDEKLAGSVKYARGKLAYEIFSATGPMNLKAEDIKTIKDLIPKLYGPLIVYRTFPLLDPAEK